MVALIGFEKPRQNLINFQENSVFSMNHKYQLKMVVQNMTQVKPRSPAITQRLLEHDLTRLNGLTISCYSSELKLNLFKKPI